MTWLDIAVRSPAAHALGWTLAHSLWQGAVVALGLAAVLAVVRRSRVRYATACAAMAALLVSFAATFAWFYSAEPVPDAARRMAGTLGAFEPSLSWISISAERNIGDLLPWLVPFWAAGVAAFSIRNAAVGWAARRLRLRGVCCAPDGWQQHLGRLQARLGVTKPVALLESCLTRVPVVMGHFRPVILIPAGLLAGLPANQVELILLHELAHIRRHDYLVNLFQLLAETLLFYHPAAWWVSSVIRAEREKCCDDVVVATHGSAHEYAVALSALEHRRSLMGEPALAATGGTVVTRIRRLLYPHHESGSGLLPLVSAALVTATAAAFVAAQTPEMAALLATPYQRWITQDVVYIIEEEERTAFERLQTDEEREHSIEQFWLRRDPTPGTPVNEFKEEHYRRIAYANERFATNLPGWQTDRGRVYIAWGPPDEIDSHPGGGVYNRPPEEGGGTAPVFPFEQWLYRYIEGAGANLTVEFVDKTGSGEFRLTADPRAKYRTAADPPTGAAYFSRGSGTPAVVVVTPEKTLLARIPLELAAKQHFLRATVHTKDGRIVRVAERRVSLCKHSPDTFGCLEKPEVELGLFGTPLVPGSYVFEAVVRDASGTAQRAYKINVYVPRSS